MSALITCAIIKSCNIVAMRLNFSRLQMAALSTGVATVSSLAQLRVQDTNKQKQCRHNDTRLTESGNARSEQLLVMPTEPLTD